MMTVTIWLIVSTFVGVACLICSDYRYRQLKKDYKDLKECYSCLKKARENLIDSYNKLQHQNFEMDVNEVRLRDKIDTYKKDKKYLQNLLDYNDNGTFLR